MYVIVPTRGYDIDGSSPHVCMGYSVEACFEGVQVGFSMRSTWSSRRCTR